jgi:PmbA protein
MPDDRSTELLAELVGDAHQAVELARAAGASDVFAGTSRSRSVDYSSRNGTLEKTSEATTRELSLEVWVDGRYGSSTTTDLRPDQLAAFATDLVALTRALEPDPDRRITDPALYQGRSTADLELYDPAVAAMTNADRTALLGALSAEVVGRDHVVSATTWVSDDHSAWAAVSSNGFEGSAQSTSVWFGADATLRDEGDKRPEDGMAVGARHRADLPDPARVGKEALAWATARLGTTKGPTRQTVMVVHPRAAARLVAGLLSSCDGPSLQQKRSFWAGQLGQKRVAESLRIVDDPWLKRGFASRLWDGEGVATKVMPVIEGGALVNAYLDTTYARKLGQAPTTGSASNRVVTPGKRDLAAIVTDVNSGVHVTSWLGGNLNGTTGDFSFGLRGRLVENGALAGPVGEMNVTGNIVELFARLREVGSDPWMWSATRAPTLVFDDVQFSGA